MAEYIDKQAAIAAIKKDIMGGLNYESILKKIPSADVQPVKHGRWLFYKPPDNWFEMRLSPKSFYVCDICGHIVGEISNYCPGCGSVMYGGDF